jgi:penicillin-binding protein 1A
MARRGTVRRTDRRSRGGRRRNASGPSLIDRLFGAASGEARRTARDTRRRGDVDVAAWFAALFANAAPQGGTERGGWRGGGRRGRRYVPMPAVVLVALGGVAAVFLGGLLLLAGLQAGQAGLPELKAELTGSPQIAYLDSRGGMLGFTKARAGPRVRLAELPPYVPLAFVAVEDPTFYRHDGVSTAAVVRAFLSNARAGEVREGGSTLTQQLVKNVLLDRRKTYSRKFQEALITRNVESQLRRELGGKRAAKDRILEYYLAIVDFGSWADAKGKSLHNKEGLFKAADLFFGTTPDRLTLGQAAVLAAVVNNPRIYNPCTAFPAAARRAKSRVLPGLAELREAGLGPEALAAAAAEIDAMRPCPRSTRGWRFATDQLAADLRLDDLATTQGKDLFVFTTLDRDAQAAAEQVVGRRMQGYPGLEAALVAADADGAVRAVVGGSNYVGGLNRAFAARRQLASVYKTFIYLTALQDNPDPEQLCLDRPAALAFPGGGAFQPRNDSGTSLDRPVTLRYAFTHSLNIVASRTAYSLGYDRVTRYGEALGVKAPQAVAAWPLIAEATPAEAANAFLPLAATGDRAGELHLYTQIIDRDRGSVRTWRPERPARALASAQRAAMNALAQGVVASGSGRRAAVPGLSIAGKTGTSTGNRDGWFVGYGAGFVVAVWVGDDHNGGAGARANLQGGNLPAQIFHDFIEAQALGWGRAPLWPAPAAPASGPHAFVAGAAQPGVCGKR